MPRGRKQDVIAREPGLYKNGRLWWVRTVRDPATGDSCSLSTGTADLRRANQIKQMVDLFHETPRNDHHYWLGMLVRKRVTLEELYLHWESHELHMLRLQIEARGGPDLDELAERWITTHLPTLDVTEKSKSEYARHVRYFVPKGERFPVAKLTADYIQTKLTEIIGARHDRTLAANNSTRRQYLSSLRAFVQYLRKKVEGFVDPLPDVPWPKKVGGRMVYYEYPKVRAILEQIANPEHRAALALLFGTGMELGALMAMTGADVGSPAERTVVAHGTKNNFREDRTIFVDQWAWDVFYPHASTVLPKAAMWSFTPFELRNAFYQAQVACGLIEKPIRTAQKNFYWASVKPHTLHDCRHSYCVNRSLGLDGEPARDTSFLSAQLGHADETMVLRIYKKLNISERLRLSQMSMRTPAAQPNLSILRA